MQHTIGINYDKSAAVFFEIFPNTEINKISRLKKVIPQLKGYETNML